MSGTKQMARSVKVAGNEQLFGWEMGLEREIAACRNPMVRSSLKQQLYLVKEEQARRELHREGGAA
jgi:hypothetical protein